MGGLLSVRMGVNTGRGIVFEEEEHDGTAGTWAIGMERNIWQLNWM
jgi:hypothetical protein